jgi:phosphatidyl-myo-inositol dimannoside synthase
VAKVVTPVAIGNNVWLGLKSIVIGNTIGDNSFIKPLSLVISDVVPNTIASGVPARPERPRAISTEAPPPKSADVRAVFLTTGCFDKGGISRYCRYQIQALREVLGPGNVKVLSLLGPDGNGFETPFEVDWHGDRGSFWDKLQFSKAAARLVLSSRADVVHVAHVNMGPLAVQLGRLTGATTLLNVYGLELWSGFSARRRRAMSAMDRIVADCNFSADFVATGNMHARRPEVIWDCVDLDLFTPGDCPREILRKYGLPDKREHFVIMSLGRLARVARHKGYDRLIEVFATVHRQAPHARLVIAGRGDDRPRLDELAGQHGVREAIIFTGIVEEEDLADCYRAATVFSLVSDRGHRRGEGIPLTPLEAMSCGVPILVGNQDGSMEAIVTSPDGISNGHAIDPFDLDRHARLFIDLANSPERLRKMGARARMTAEQLFGYPRFVEQHRKLYEELFGENVTL